MPLVAPYLVITVALWLPQERPASIADFPDRETLQRAFEAAVARSDQDTVERLIRSNDGQLFLCFDEYAKTWIESAGNDAAQRIQLDRMRAIARAASSVFAGDALLDVVELLPAFDQPQRATWLEAYHDFRRGHDALQAGQHEQAIASLDAADRWFDQLEWITGVATVRLNLGLAHSSQGNSDHAIRLLQEACELWQRIGAPRETSHVWAALGSALYRSGQELEGAKAYETSLSFAKLAGNKRYLFLLHEIGLDLCAMEQLAAALPYFARELEAADALHDAPTARRALVQLGGWSIYNGQDLQGLQWEQKQAERFPDAFLVTGEWKVRLLFRLRGELETGPSVGIQLLTEEFLDWIGLRQTQ